MSPTAPQLLTFNGIDGTTGEYDIPPMSAQDLARAACGTVLDPQQLSELRWRRQQDSESHFAVKEGVDPKNLAQTGWGVIFTHDVSPAVVEALRPLLDFRRGLAGDRYREYAGPTAYRPAESKPSFLARNGAGPGPVDPTTVPYYLLIVGDPESIPFRFQYQLDVQYAVGRIHFDSPEEYARYAQTVIAAESGKLSLARRAAFFGVANPDDGATNLSAADLVQPLVNWAAADQPAWTIRSYVREQAVKSQLAALLGGSDTPALLFTASHGMSFPGDPRQVAQQGALLCQNWPGPVAWAHQRIPQDFYFAGDDLASDARLMGLISMHFACYGAGTPQLSDFPGVGVKDRPTIAPHAFVGQLPRSLLSHPRGGALAAIGHVERAWGYSFHWDRVGSQTEVFKSTLKRLMEGHPVGSALEYFNGRYAELSSDLSTELEDVSFGKVVNEFALSGLWTANNDARSYTVIGDPAVRLMLADANGPEQRPIMETITIASSPAPAAPPAPLAVAPRGELPAGAMPYGLFDPLKEGQARIAASLQQLAEKVGGSLAAAFQSLTTVEVSTYVSDNISEVKYENGSFTGARLRALTRVSLDGNTLVCVPEQDGKVDDTLWKIHSDIVGKALENRTEMLKLAMAAASSLMGGFKLT